MEFGAPPIEEGAVVAPCVTEGVALVVNDDDPPGVDCIIIPGIVAPCPMTVAVPFMFIITGTIIMTCEKQTLH
jgi:hypothetical protein